MDIPNPTTTVRPFPFFQKIPNPFPGSDHGWSRSLGIWTPGFFWGWIHGIFFPTLWKSREHGSLNPDFLLGIARSCPRDHSEFPGLGAAPDLGESWLEFQESRMESGIWAGICYLSWKNPGWNSGNPGWNSKIQARNVGIQDGIWDLGWNSGVQAGVQDLGWKNPGWNSGIQDGRIQAGIQECRAHPMLPKSSGLRQFPAAFPGPSRASGSMENFGKGLDDPKIPAAFP